jgi:hypothetical protein
MSTRGNIRCLLLATSRVGVVQSGAGELAQPHLHLILSVPLPCRTICVISRHLSFIPLLNLNHHHLSLMLRLSLFAYTKPLFGPVAPRSGLKAFPLRRGLRSFGSAARPRILEVIRNRPSNFVTKPFQQSSRGIVDSAVISRPSQTDAWRRYAITAVC